MLHNKPHVVVYMSLAFTPFSNLTFSTSLVEMTFSVLLLLIIKLDNFHLKVTLVWETLNLHQSSVVDSTRACLTRCKKIKFLSLSSSTITWVSSWRLGSFSEASSVLQPRQAFFLEHINAMCRVPPHEKQ